MAVEFTSGFETGDFTGWTSQSPTPPTVAGAYLYKGAYGMQSDSGAIAQWTRYRIGTPPATMCGRFYIYITSTTASTLPGVASWATPSQSKDTTLLLNCDGSNVRTLKMRIYDGVSTFNSTSTGTLSVATWYRIEYKMDWSGAAAKVTWGIATADGSLTTIDTDFTGGNAFGAATIDYCLHGQGGVSVCVLRYDDVAISNSGGDYPLGPTGPTVASLFSTTSPLRW
jgi:hypothetical protein